MSKEFKVPKNLTKEQLLRKSDQESEMGSMAIADGDKKGAEKHFAKSRAYMAAARELHVQGM